MTLLTQKLSKLFFAETMSVVTLALFFIVFGASATPAQTKKVNATAANGTQVPFTATGTATITSVTKLPGGLTQVNFDTSGSATHLGNFTGPLTRLQDNQGNFGSTAVIVGANGTDSVFFSISGTFGVRAGATNVWSLPREFIPSPAGLARSPTPRGAEQSRRSSTCARVPPVGRIRGRSRSRTRTKRELV